MDKRNEQSPALRNYAFHSSRFGGRKAYGAVLHHNAAAKSQFLYIILLFILLS